MNVDRELSLESCMACGNRPTRPTEVTVEKGLTETVWLCEDCSGEGAAGGGDVDGGEDSSEDST